MSYVITDECVSCGACASVCPTNAIKDAGSKYEINPKKCTSCGACCNLCPVDAIINEGPAKFVPETTIKQNKPVK